MEFTSNDVCEKCTDLHIYDENFPLEYNFQVNAPMRCPVCLLILNILPRSRPLQAEPKKRIVEQTRKELISDTSKFNAPRCHLLRDYGEGLQFRPGGKFPARFRITQGSQHRGYIYITKKSQTFKRYNYYIGGFLPCDSTQCRPALNFCVVKDWIDNCSRNHSCGYNNSIGSTALKLFFVDVEQNCLVEESIDNRYIALSYVRGSVAVFETFKAHIDELSQPGSLSLYRLNQVFLDSIECCRRLGERFLWIDAVCIPQDEGPHKAALIQQMDLIYGQAVLTIIAMGGENADSPLHGVSMERTYCVDTLNIVDRSPKHDFPERYTVCRPHLFREVRDLPHSHRGWTLQENIMATRSLVFLENRVLFLCGQSGMLSDAPIHSSERKMKGLHYSIHSMRRAVSERERIILYVRAVEDYTRRELTYSSDALNAINGVLAAMSREFGWQFTAGLPAHLLHCVLTWFHPIDEATRNEEFPAWSWLGWIGGVWIFSFDERDLGEHSFTDIDKLAEITLVSEHEPSTQTAVPASSVKDGLRISGCTAPLCDFLLEPLERPANRNINEAFTAAKILNRDGAHCGFLSFPKLRSLNLLDREKLEFVALSKFRFNIGSENTFREVLDRSRDDSCYEVGDQMELVQVLLIMWVGNTVEKVGTGRFYADCWNRSTTESKSILLL